jgi:hypothetical protein
MNKNNINIHYASHSLRIIELLNDILADTDYTKLVNLRVMNCVTFKFTLNTNETTIELIHEGEGVKYNGSYITHDTFPLVTIPTSNITTKRLHTSCTIYLTRHGESEHNIVPLEKYEDVNIDTNLTDAGIQQALTLKNKLNDITFDYYLCTDLVRTRETLYNIHGDVTYTMLPCSGEYDRYECSVNTNKSIKNNCSGYTFNIPKYEYSTLRKAFVNDNNMTTKLDGYTIDLTYYTDDYCGNNILETVLNVIK